MPKELSILIGGSAGQGSRKAGLMIAKLLSSYGYHIFIYDDYQSLIRGGHSFSHIMASEKEVLSHKEKIDFLLALDKTTIEKHIKKLKKQGIVIYNGKIKGKNKVNIDIESIAKESGGNELMGNMALVASFAKIVGFKWEDIEKLFNKEFKGLLRKINLKIAKKAFNISPNLVSLKKLKSNSLSLLTGNEAIALGAIKAGLKTYIAYPMTPATGILHYLARDKRVKTIQLENEISVINATLGSSYAGSRTMVGTSGGGFALMAEAVSLAVQAEIPIVIVESQRMAPGTGVPTYTGQGDLLFVRNVGHGDIVKFVVAPGDAEEACLWSGKLLNLSWKYQTPSVLLVDKEVSESTFSFNKRILDRIKNEKPLLWNGKGEYMRYKKTKNGISPIAFPGNKKAIVKVNSYEHDEFGITTEEEDKVKEMQDKRLRKFKAMEKEIERLKPVNVYGKKDSKQAIIAWGSTKGPAKEVAEELGIKMVQPVVIEPFPIKEMQKALKGVKKIILVETNSLGQMEQILNSYGIKVDKKILKYTGRPFLPEELKKHVIKYLR